MSQENNFIPEQESYKKITPFRLFVKSNFPFIESTYEALDNYGLYCKVVEYLNNVIENENTVESNVGALYDAFVSLNNYVSDYFDNLDVTEEINDKLDELVSTGDLQNIMMNIFTILQNQINAIASGSPMAVDSIDEMTDVNRIYVLTTNGNWYFNDGTTWVSGGVYQSEVLSDKSIDILNLDDYLQANYNMTFSDDIALGTTYSGYVRVLNNNINIQQSTDYKYHIVQLEPNQIYQFNGFNSFQACGIIVTDSDDNILYNTNIPETSQAYEYCSLLFRVKETGCKAYISIRIPVNIYDLVRIRKLIDVSNNLKINTEIPLLKTYNNYICSQMAGQQFSVNSLTTDPCSVRLYPIEKGKKYHLTGTDIFSIACFSIYDNNYTCTYSSRIGSVDTATERDYTFIATDNGFVQLTNYKTYVSNIEIVYDSIDIQTTNVLANKKISADGDSIVDGNVSSGNIAFPEMIASRNEMTLVDNLAVGGGTIATGTYSGSTPRHWISTSVMNLNVNTNYVLIGGGVNDYWQNVPLGSYTDSFTDNVDSETFYGGLETLARNLINKFTNGQKIIFVIYHKMNNIYTSENSNGNTYKDFYDAIIKVMNKYSIPICDLSKNSQFNTAITYYKNTYTNNSDGIHPTTNGYNNYYNSIIENKMKSL